MAGGRCELAAVDQQDQLVGAARSAGARPGPAGRRSASGRAARPPPRPGTSSRRGSGWRRRRRTALSTMFCSRNTVPPGIEIRVFGLRQQRADDVQRVGQHLQVQRLQVRAHLQGGGAAVDDHRLARRGRARRRRGRWPPSARAWRPMFSWKGTPLRCARRSTPARAISRAPPRTRTIRPACGQALQVAPQGRRRGVEPLVELLEADEAAVARAAAGSVARVQPRAWRSRSWRLARMSGRCRRYATRLCRNAIRRCRRRGPRRCVPAPCARASRCRGRRPIGVDRAAGLDRAPSPGSA